MQVFYSDHVDLPLPPGHRFPKTKYRAVRDALSRERLVRADAFRAAPAADVADIRAVHAPVYVDAFLAGTLSAAEIRRIGFPWSQGLVRRTLASVGATGAAADAALRDGVACALSGGTHHAHYDFGAGFCVFNDFAVAAHRLLNAGEVQRIAVLDVDVHQGDGTAALFAEDARVLTCSIHGARNFPLRKSVSDIDVALPDGTEDDEYLQALEGVMPRVLAHRPDVVFVQAGVDALAADRLGRLALTAQGLMRRDEFILGTLTEHKIPFLVTMGGGYADPIDASVEAYVNTYRVLATIRDRLSQACPLPGSARYTRASQEEDA